MTTHKNEIPILLASLTLTLAMIGAGFWWVKQNILDGTGLTVGVEAPSSDTNPPSIVPSSVEKDKSINNGNGLSTPSETTEGILITSPSGKSISDGTKDPETGVVPDIKVETSEPDVISLYREIKDDLEGSTAFINGDNSQNTGRIFRNFIRESSKPNSTGAVAHIKWDDGLQSNMIFRADKTVAVWESGARYEGRWFRDSSGMLRVRMDDGARYEFRPR